jgi:hypothetical protein
MMSDADEKLLSGKAWHEFCDELKAVGDVIIGADSSEDTRERTDGFRYLTRLLS